ncbi:MAG: PAS domain-containing protein [Kiloniellales bacterium]|nr:PAS domain-containing protein [Kiloniellales bacterium]
MQNEPSFTARSVDLEQLDDAKLEALLAYWEARRGGHVYPMRRDLLPEDMASLLTRLALVDVLDDRIKFRFRLVGSLLQHAFGVDPTGSALETIAPAAYRDLFAAHFRAVLWSEAPLCRQIEIRRGLRSFTFRCLVLPVSEDGSHLDRLLVAANWGDREAPVRDLLRPRRF